MDSSELWTQWRSRSEPANKRNRAILSCTECHRRKQKCDRKHPCNICQERKVPYKCQFKHWDVLDRIDKATSSSRNGLPIRKLLPNVAQRGIEVATLQGYDSSLSPRSQAFQTYHLVTQWEEEAALRSSVTHFGELDVFDVLPKTPAEVPKSLLINYFTQMLAPWLSSYRDSMTAGEYAWLPEALNHAPLFHATLLTAIVHLGKVRRWTDHYLAIWCKVETIRLVNEHISIENGAASDEMIVTILILLYFHVGCEDLIEYEVHLTGIQKLLQIRGGMENLGMRGQVRNWLTVCYGPWSDNWDSISFYEYFNALVAEERSRSVEKIFSK